MRALLGASNRLKRWQIGVPTALILASVIATLAIFACTTESAEEAAGLGEDQEAAIIQKRPVAKVIPVNSRLRFPNKVELTFDFTGKVAEILVHEGQWVEADQVLAKLDAITIGRLGEVFAQKRVDLDETQEKLDDFRRDYGQVLAKAQQAEAEAEVNLDKTQEKLDDFRRDYEQELAQAMQTKADGELNLDQAREAADDFRRDYDQELAQAMQTKAEGELKLDQAKEALEDFSRNYQQKLAQAMQDKADADLELDEAQKRLGNFDLDLSQELAQARQAVADAELTLDRAEKELDDFDLDYLQELTNARKTQADAEVALRKTEDALSDWISNPTRDPRETDTFFDVKVLRRLQVAVAEAQANINNALDDVAELEDGPDPLERQELEDSEPSRLTPQPHWKTMTSTP